MKLVVETYESVHHGPYRLHVHDTGLPDLSFGPFRSESQAEIVGQDLESLAWAGALGIEKDPQLPGLEVTAFGIPLWFTKCAWEDDPAHPDLATALAGYRAALRHRPGVVLLESPPGEPFQARPSVIRDGNWDISAGKYRFLTTRDGLRDEVLSELRTFREAGLIRVGIANWSPNVEPPNFAVRVTPTPRGAVETYPSSWTLRGALKDACLLRGLVRPVAESYFKSRFEREFLV